MGNLDNNIEAVTKAAQSIEKKLCEENMSMTPGKIVANCKQMLEFINAANLMNQIKAAQSAQIITPKKGLFKM
jgi:peptidyl-tRNA hydrolase